MNSLILDTSTEYCIAAIAQDDQILVQEVFPHQNRLSETLLPALQVMIEKHCHFPKNIHTIAFGIGPGSYTGTRLGAAVAKSLAFGLEIPAKAFASPLAFLPSREGSFAFIIPTRNGQFYVLRGSQMDTELRIESPFFVRQEELDTSTKADFIICSQVDKLPEVFKNTCFAPTPNLPLLADWLSKQEPTLLEQIELVYLGTP